MSMLFSPAFISGIKLKNRIIFPPITTNAGQSDGRVSDGQIKYYSQIAAGGVGAVIVEPVAISPQGRLITNSLGLWDDHLIPGLANLAAAIKKQGAAAILQLVHAGTKGMEKVNGIEPLTPSGIPMAKRGRAKELSKAEIQEIIEQFVQAAVRAKKAGFEAVELHAAHFYLLSSFLSPALNKRSDEYGGSTQGRVKIVTDIIKGIKECLGTEYPVICRINGRESLDSALGKGIDAAELRSICLELEKAGADALHISAYTILIPALEKHINIPYTSMPGPRDAPGCFSDYAAEVKQYVQVPVLTVGKIESFSVAEEILTAGKADFVAMGRGLIADPELPHKMEKGAEGGSCLYCSKCMDSILKGTMSCAVNTLPLG